ncbi:fimbrial protein [uncultured Bacteroides sp.]|uniref:fimbrial protein n=1 Tax=uncultured Bacteroides sp. TaxID=162156 RepID=UPI0025D8074F|nr:fimbrial protein [uncultured Bacteroides sp.]
MIVKWKYSQSVLLLLLFFLAACDSEMPNTNGTENKQEQLILRLNVKQESVVQTRGAVAPAEDERIESLDFLIFNHNGDIVDHLHPSLEWAGDNYKTTVRVSSATGEHTLYLIANYSMEEGTIHNLKELESKICTTLNASVKPPFVMATKRITLASLNAATIHSAMNSGGNNDGFSLIRNVAKFGVEVNATNFKVKSLEWIGCPTSATVLAGVNYTSPNTMRVSNLTPLKNPVYLYQIPNMGSEPHKGFHVVVHGEYTAADGTKREGYYKLRLSTLNTSGDKVALTSIVGNNYYKLNIQSVTGFGSNSLEAAEKNGFTNDMEALTMLDYSSSHNYQENFLQNGYQMGLENSHWVIYNNDIMNSFTLGYFYRCIRDQSLVGYTTFDPDYPNLQRGVITVEANGAIVNKPIACNDTPDTPVEMKLLFTDLNNTLEKEGYTFTGIIQYGVFQKTVTVEHYPSIEKSYTVLTMSKTSYGEVVGSHSWMGIAEQRHEGATIYQQLDSENDYIFVHILKNNTGKAREGIIRLFGKNGYYELQIHQKG